MFELFVIIVILGSASISLALIGSIIEAVEEHKEAKTRRGQALQARARRNQLATFKECMNYEPKGELN